MKKDVNILALALTFTGSFLGAGFVSGQELWQFFGQFGRWGFFGLGLSMLLFFVFGVLLFRLVQQTGSMDAGQMMVPMGNGRAKKWIGKAIVYMQMLFLLGVTVIMSAGIGALTHQLFHLPNALGCGIFCALIFLFSLLGVRGMITVFSVLVGPMALFSIGICLWILVKFGMPMPSEHYGGMLWLFQALLYLSYNMFCSAAILIPVAARVKRRSTAIWGILLGAAILGMLAASILLALHALPATAKDELPMLSAATQCANWAGWVYAALLFCGMFGAALSSMVALVGQIKLQHTGFSRCQVPLTLCLTLFVFGGSLFGFGNLIGIIYPIFGVLGFVALAGILRNTFYLHKKNG